MTINDIAALPAEDVVQRHDRVDESDERFQEGLHQLAVRCGNCGNAEPITIRFCAMPDEAGR